MTHINRSSSDNACTGNIRTGMTSVLSSSSDTYTTATLSFNSQLQPSAPWHCSQLQIPAPALTRTQLHLAASVNNCILVTHIIRSSSNNAHTGNIRTGIISAPAPALTRMQLRLSASALSFSSQLHDTALSFISYFQLWRILYSKYPYLKWRFVHLYLNLSLYTYTIYLHSYLYLLSYCTTERQENIQLPNSDLDVACTDSGLVTLLTSPPQEDPR